MPIVKFNGFSPRMGRDVYISENVSVIGDVEIGDESSLWFGSVLRGDICYIKVGSCSNVQDNAVLHVGYDLPVVIGNYVTVGHSAIIHGAIISDYVIVGMGAIVLDGAKIGSNVIIGAGTVVPPKMEIPNGVLVLGVPGKIVRELRQEEIEGIKVNALDYVKLAKIMRGGV
ncbi:MAG: gamma carbonic anhydrase family protein [Brevinematia bacterium]